MNSVKNITSKEKMLITIYSGDNEAYRLGIALEVLDELKWISELEHVAKREGIEYSAKIMLDSKNYIIGFITTRELFDMLPDKL